MSLLPRTDRIDTERCKAEVPWPSGFHYHQCEKKAKKDGFCTVHHPDYAKAKRAKREEEFKEREEMFERVHATAKGLIERLGAGSCRDFGIWLSFEDTEKLIQRLEERAC